jgi:hypothetical protein
MIKLGPKSGIDFKEIAMKLKYPRDKNEWNYTF